MGRKRILSGTSITTHPWPRWFSRIFGPPVPDAITEADSTSL